MVHGVQEDLQVVKPERLLKVAGAGNDPMKAIGSLPGVTFSGSAGAAPAVRGSSPQENLYLIDFLPVGYIFHVDGSSIMSDNTIGDFKLDSSAFSARYNNSNAAVIEANSRDVYDTSQAIVDVSFLRAGVFLEHGEQTDYGSHGGYFSARQSLFQYYLEQTMEEDDLELITMPQFYDYQGRYQWRWGNNDVSLQWIGARDKAGLEYDEDSDEVQQDPELLGGVEMYQRFNSLGLVWDKVYDSGLIQRIGAYRLGQMIRFELGANNDLDIDFVDKGLRSEFSQSLNANHTLSWGLHYVHRTMTAAGQLTYPPCDEFEPDCRASAGDETLLIDEDHPFNNWDLFIEDEWQINDQWRVTAGLLGSYDDYTEQQFVEPKLSTDYQLNDQWSINAAWGKYHKLPEDFFAYTPDFGNRDLKQPQSTHYEFGIANHVSDTLLVKLDTYYKTMSNLVVGRPDADNYPDLTEEQYLALPSYSNDAEGRAWGAELFINKDLSEHWYGWMSVAWSRTLRHNQLTDEHFTYAYDQPVVVNLVASYAPNDNWTFGLKWRARSGQLITPIEGASYNDEQGAYEPQYGSLNSERMPMQHNLDLRADRSIESFGQPVDLYFEIINLYGSKNVDGYEYNGDYSERDEINGLPTMFSIGAKIHLI